MEYKTSALNTEADCDSLIAMAQNEKSSLEFQKNGLVYHQGSFAKTAVEIDAEISGVELELASINQVVDGLPEGEYKDSLVIKKMRLDLRLKVLENREEKFGVQASLLKDNDLARVELELQEVTVFIAAIEARKTELQAAA